MKYLEDKSAEDHRIDKNRAYISTIAFGVLTFLFVFVAMKVWSEGGELVSRDRILCSALTGLGGLLPAWFGFHTLMSAIDSRNAMRKERAREARAQRASQATVAPEMG